MQLPPGWALALQGKPCKDCTNVLRNPMQLFAHMGKTGQCPQRCMSMCVRNPAQNVPNRLINTGTRISYMLILISTNGILILTV